MCICEHDGGMTREIDSREELEHLRMRMLILTLLV